MNFIEIYDDALSSEKCDELIDYFNNNPKMKGVVGGNMVVPSKKKSTELKNSVFSLHKLPFQFISSEFES